MSKKYSVCGLTVQKLLLPSNFNHLFGIEKPFFYCELHFLNLKNRGSLNLKLSGSRLHHSLHKNVDLNLWKYMQIRQIKHGGDWSELYMH